MTRFLVPAAPRSFVLGLAAVLVTLAAPVASSQGTAARPGRGYVARTLTGGVPVGAVRGQYPGTTTDVLFVVNHPTPDSTAFSAFVGGRLVRRLALPLSADIELFDADIPRPPEGEPVPARVYAAFAFDSPDAVFHVVWNHRVDRWAAVVRGNADGSETVYGDAEWFGAEALGALYAQGGPEGGLPTRAHDRDSRRLAAPGSASLRVERAVYAEVPDAYYRIAVYDGEIGPMQTMNGIAVTSAPDLDAADVQSCSGLPAVADVNGDGHADFWLCDAEAVNGYQTGAYRLYDPEAGLFVKDLAFSFRGLHTFDPETRTIQERRWSSAGDYETHRTYDLTSGRPVLVRE